MLALLNYSRKDFVVDDLVDSGSPEQVPGYVNARTGRISVLC